MEGAVAVIGAGSWGTALTRPLADQGRPVNLWAHRSEHVETLKQERENTTYLPGYRLAPCIRPVAGLEEAVRGCRVVLMVVPSHVFRPVFQELAPFLEDDAYVISAAKGIENDTLMTMTRVMADVLSPGVKRFHPAVLSGPSFAREVVDGVPTAVTLAAATLDAARYCQQIISTERFRVYGATDIIGLELGGALKNVVAIAAGISDGLGYGTNTRAALITRGLAEISRLGVSMGANPLTFSGLGGLGDLILTCTGGLSRNRTVGLQLGQGRRLADILADMKMVAEGVKTTASGQALARKMGVEMPIQEQIYQVLYHNKPCDAAVRDLLARNLRDELET